MPAAEAVLVAVHTADAPATGVALGLPPGVRIPITYVAERLDAPGAPRRSPSAPTAA